MKNIDLWIENLSDPLVLIGFSLFLIINFFKFLLSRDRVSIKFNKKITLRILNFGSVLVALVILLGFYFAVHRDKKNTVTSKKTDSKNLMTKGDQSPIIDGSQGNIEITFQGFNKTNAAMKEDKQEHFSPSTGELKHTEGNQSPIINSGKDIKLNYKNSE